MNHCEEFKSRAHTTRANRSTYIIKMVPCVATKSQEVTGSEGPRVPDESLDDGVEESRSDKADPVVMDVRE